MGLRHQGNSVTPEQPFIVTTNNYPASGGSQFPGLDGNNMVLAAPDGSREILARWLQRKGQIRAADMSNIHLLKDHGDGTATYAIDLSS